ncbi:hypothetical protein BCR33DRAFT_712460 [Rhizoclosmatium globosum]|uniref:G-protein coupled receptors family 1 profile domain-containing protein n=1 Tax=Rhizoclosmatium globosum TaxID=329046 RepID=A0A1Y2CX25_9FUNG|nr:hypothetical protein BCR33DRAFT_712460 [Rhizoclosmatium globosum]|eukprot:ORY51394.1 hypothetical protein BCR33DRAFT_712460 [Rhizoclosmatium globosum]
MGNRANSTNVTETDSVWEPYYDAYQKAVVQDMWVISCITLLHLLVFAILVRMEISAPILKKKKKIFSSINSLLLSIILLHFLANMLNYAYSSSLSSDPIYIVTYIIVAWFFTCFQECAMTFYAYRRGIAVIEAIFPSSRIFMIGCLLFIAFGTVCQFVWVSLANISFYLPYLTDYNAFFNKAFNAHSVALSIAIFCFDTGICGVYLYYLRVAEEQEIGEIEKLKVLSKYGLLSCCCLWLWHGSLTLFLYSSYAETPPFPLWIYILSQNMAELIPLLYVTVQLVMKWNLLVEERTRIQLMQKRMDRAKTTSFSTCKTIVKSKSF